MRNGAVASQRGPGDDGSGGAAEKEPGRGELMAET